MAQRGELDTEQQFAHGERLHMGSRSLVRKFQVGREFRNDAECSGWGAGLPRGQPCGEGLEPGSDSQDKTSPPPLPRMNSPLLWALGSRQIPTADGAGRSPRPPGSAPRSRGTVHIIGEVRGGTPRGGLRRASAVKRMMSSTGAASPAPPRLEQPVPIDGGLRWGGSEARRTRDSLHEHLLTE